MVPSINQNSFFIARVSRFNLCSFICAQNFLVWLMNLSPLHFVLRLLDKTNTSSNLELAHGFLWFISASWWMDAGHYLLLLLLKSIIYLGIIFCIILDSYFLVYSFMISSFIKFVRWICKSCVCAYIYMNYYAEGFLTQFNKVTFPH
jgi:hypothetical protein